MVIDKEDVVLERDIVKSIPDHQSLISFGDDTANIMFQAWWYQFGKGYFLTWAQLQDEKGYE